MENVADKFEFDAEVEIEDEENEWSRTVVLPFVCSTYFEKPDLDVGYYGGGGVGDIHLSPLAVQKGMVTPKEAQWIEEVWIKENEKYLEELAIDEFDWDDDNNNPYYQ